MSGKESPASASDERRLKAGGSQDWTPHWRRVTATDNVPLREGRSVTLDGVEIALFNLGDRFVAIQNACPHQGGPLCEGIVAGTTVVCPLHGWGFDLDTGGAVRASLPVCLTVYPVRVENGVILVDAAGGSRIDGEAAA